MPANCRSGMWPLPRLCHKSSGIASEFRRLARKLAVLAGLTRSFATETNPMRDPPALPGRQ